MYSDNNTRSVNTGSANPSYLDATDMFDDMFPELKQFNGQDDFQPYAGNTGDAIVKAPTGGSSTLRGMASGLSDANDAQGPGNSQASVANNDYMLLDMLSKDVSQSYKNNSGLF